jgi:hypothetical protein
MSLCNDFIIASSCYMILYCKQRTNKFYYRHSLFCHRYSSFANVIHIPLNIPNQFIRHSAKHINIHDRWSQNRRERKIKQHDGSEGIKTE